MTTREPSNSTEFWAEWTQTASGGVHCCVLSFLTIKTKPHLKWYEVTHTSTLQSGLNTQSNPIYCRTALDKHYLREHSGNLLHKTCIMKNQIKANHGEGGGGGGQGCVCTTISTMYCTQTDLKIMGCTGPHTRVYTQRTCPRSTICWAWICFICWMMPGFFFLILPELFVPWIWSNIWRYSKQSLLLLFFFFSFRLTMLFQLNLNFM